MVDQPQERRYESDRGPEYEPEYAPPGPRYQSGAVTLVAVLNFVMAGLQVVGIIIVLVLGGAILGLTSEAAKATGDADAQKVAAAAGGIAGAIVAIAIVCGIIFIALFLLAGIGVLNRRQYGRIISLILGAIMGILALLSILNLGTAPLNAIINILILGGYCVVTYVVLLNSTYAREFR